MPSFSENKEFVESVINIGYLLDDAIAFIKDTYEPSDIFDKIDLESWAEENGYRKDNENE